MAHNRAPRPTVSSTTPSPCRSARSPPASSVQGHDSRHAIAPPHRGAHRPGVIAGSHDYRPLFTITHVIITLVHGLWRRRFTRLVAHTAYDMNTSRPAHRRRPGSGGAAPDLRRRRTKPRSQGSMTDG